MSDLFTPNFTQIPNVIFDYWMPILSPSEFKVLLCMCRKIYGWHKTTDYISISQIEKCTGLTRKTVITATEGLIKYGLVVKHQYTNENGNCINEYKLFVSIPEDVSLKENAPDTCNGTDGKFTHPSVKITPGVVEKLHHPPSVKITPTKERHSPKERPTKRISSDSQSSSELIPKNIDFSYQEKQFTGIDEQDIESWKIAYPHVDIQREIAVAVQWALSNPHKRKKNWRLFLTKWFNTNNSQAENKKAYREMSKQNPPQKTKKFQFNNTLDLNNE